MASATSSALVSDRLVTWRCGGTGESPTGVTNRGLLQEAPSPSVMTRFLRGPTTRQPERSVACSAIRIDRINKKRETDAIQSEDDLELCPAECVREIKSEKELEFIIDFGKQHDVLIVVDFYRTACGSCKYIEQGFAKLCRAEGDQQLPVMFFKHNVMDDREEMSDIADRFRIKAVPLFHFYKNGELVESFSTRDKARILETINKHIDEDIHTYLT